MTEGFDRSRRSRVTLTAEKTKPRKSRVILAESRDYQGQAQNLRRILAHAECKTTARHKRWHE